MWWQVAVGWRTRSGALLQRVCTRRLQVVADIPALVPLVDGQASALLLARAAAEEALRTHSPADALRPAHMQRIIGAHPGARRLCGVQHVTRAALLLRSPAGCLGLGRAKRCFL